MPYIDDFDVADIPIPATLLEVRTGKIKILVDQLPIQSAINKQPHQEKLFLTETGLVGDQTEYMYHGGVDKALHQYDVGHYKTWIEERPDLEHLFQPGGFGENISTAGMNEKNVCIGDQYSLGDEVIVEISEPRQPCYKLNHRFKWKKASVQIQETGRAGWYLRVIRTGHIQKGDKMALIKRPHSRWSLFRIQEILYRDLTNLDALQELSQLNELGIYIRSIFQNRLLNGIEDMSSRLKGAPELNNLVWRPYRLIMKEDLTPRIKKFVFEIAGKDEPEDISLGPLSHVRLKFEDYTRAYSVVNGDLLKFELGIAKDDNSRGGSHYLFDQFQIGDKLEGVKGHTNPPKHANIDNQRHVFIIGGIGITAFIQQIKKLEREGEICEIHYSVRSRKDAAYLDELNTCFTTKTTVYAKDENQRLDIPALITSLPPTSNTAIYTSGPPSLRTTVHTTTRALNYPPSLLHFEDFGCTDTKSGPAFKAKMKSTNQILDIPDGKSLLEVLRETGMDVARSCEVGNCGVCVVEYCEGRVEHRGVALMEEEKGGSLLSCVSRGEAGECVVLDL